MATTGPTMITFVISAGRAGGDAPPKLAAIFNRSMLVIPARTKGRGAATKFMRQRLRDAINPAGIRRILNSSDASKLPRSRT